MEAYIIKSNIALAVFYLLYRLFIYSGKQHQIKRFMGIGILIFCSLFLLIPSIRFGSPDNLIQVEELLQNTSSAINTFSADLPKENLSLFVILYLSGVSLFSTKFLIGIIGLVKLYIQSEKRRKWGFKLVETKDPISPFSFFNLLFLHKGESEKPQLEPIVIHEKLHKDQLHSIDVILLEVFSILFWFNPFIWLLRKDIKASHEFIADRHVIHKGYDKLEYQDLLFKARTGISFRAASYLSNQTSLKQRFNIMEKQASKSKDSYLRVGVVLTAMVATLFISSFASIDDSFITRKPNIQIFTASGEVDLEKGISKNIENLFLRMSPGKGDKNLAYRAVKIEATLISEGIGIASISSSNDRLYLSSILKKAPIDKESILLLEIKEYQSQNELRQVNQHNDVGIFIQIPIN